MNPQIKTIPSIKLIGQNLTFSYSDYRSFELWSNFMPRKKEIQNIVSDEMFSVQVNPENFDFNPKTNFVKWAAVPVSSFEIVPDDMQTLQISEGLYAVFHYVGNNQNADSFFRMIFSEWLPTSEYELDNRPHFEILGEKYKNNDDASEEDIYIPIKSKI